MAVGRNRGFQQTQVSFRIKISCWRVHSSWNDKENVKLMLHLRLIRVSFTGAMTTDFMPRLSCYAPENREPEVFWCCQGYRNRTLAQNKLSCFNKINVTFLTIISAAVRHDLIDLSTTGNNNSCTDLSIAGRIHCFNCGNCWNNVN